MKKFVLVILCLLLAFFLPMLDVSADIGPKRSVDILIKGIDQDYFLDILVLGDYKGDEYNFEESFETVPAILWTFSDGGYVSNIMIAPWGYPLMKIGDHHYTDLYRAPHTFKLLIIIDDHITLTSDVIHTKLFNSSIVWDLTGVDLTESGTNLGNIYEVFPIIKMTSDLFVRIVLTIAIELAILYAFGYRRKETYRFVLILNVFTQVTLTGFMFAMRYFVFPGIGEFLTLALGEIIIFILEITLYIIFLKEFGKLKAALYGFVANLCSLIFGLVILASLYLLITLF
jgi:hypothetical protein